MWMWFVAVLYILLLLLWVIFVCRLYAKGKEGSRGLVRVSTTIQHDKEQQRAKICVNVLILSTSSAGRPFCVLNLGVCVFKIFLLAFFFFFFETLDDFPKGFIWNVMWIRKLQSMITSCQFQHIQHYKNTFVAVCIVWHDERKHFQFTHSLFDLKQQTLLSFLSLFSFSQIYLVLHLNLIWV